MLREFGVVHVLMIGLTISLASLPQAQAQSVADRAADSQAFVRAAASGDLGAVEKALAEGQDIDARSDTGMTAWHAAKMNGYVELAKILADKGCDTSIPMPPAEKIADVIMSRDRPQNSPALTVLIVRDGETVFEKCYGMADVTGKRAATPKTKFRIGSIGKQFTASSILKLQEDGKLNVEDKLTDFVSDFPRGDEVTLHHLLTHTSGIHSYTSQPHFKARVGTYIETEKLIDEIKTYPFDFSPGEKWSYSNSGFYVLGRIIELVSGKSYGEFLNDEFFEPLGMSNSGVYISGKRYENEALGYSFVDGDYKPSKHWDMSWAGGAGQIYSTLEDLAIWNQAIFSGKVLKPESMQVAHTAATLNDGSKTTYGYGWGVSEFRGVRTITHAGGLDGFMANLSYYPDYDCTIVALCNCVPPPPNVVHAGSANSALAQIYLWPHLKPKKLARVAKKVDPSILRQLVGRYDLSGAVLTISRDDDQLFASVVGQNRIKLLPKSDLVYVTSSVDAEIEFFKDKQDNIARAVLRQDGQVINADRMADLAVAEMSEEQLDIFVGKYEYQGLGTMSIRRDGNKLFAQMTGQPELEVYPKSKSELHWKDLAAKLVFEYDEQGTLTKIVHHQGGQSLEVTKSK